uniref:DDE Tnp4 domain-containing protein n=1 Tax=Seriola dumerili TaxID=41447 RepID=A0A3B4U9L6_SERDU
MDDGFYFHTNEYKTNDNLNMRLERVEDRNLQNFMLHFGILILSTLQTLSGQNFNRARRSHSLCVEEQVVIALRFYASGSFHQVVGDNIGVDKSTVSDVVKAVSITLASLASQPSASSYFWGTCPILLGLSTALVYIQAPHEREWEYVNRKGRHSMNIEGAFAVCGLALYKQLQNNQPDGIILRDSAYPLIPWLMTPFLAPNTPEYTCLNTANCKTRCAIERLNGVVKRCFACLNYLRVEPQGTCNIILAFIVLTISVPSVMSLSVMMIYDAPEPVENSDTPAAVSQNERVTGHAIRKAIVRN